MRSSGAVGFFLLFHSAMIAASLPSAPTFYKDIVPILQDHCVQCHRPGEVAPMSLITYEQVRPWAAAIKEAVVLRKMPPWASLCALFSRKLEGPHLCGDKGRIQPHLEITAAW